ncbi:hypothetical protein [Chondromyces apiculatus]|uniref:Lipoprotein n=1 Tax=Chondromyces apiculatus DSM 436 TaxID=1192034 RepID=A0A017T812_9BACT|nr:hypothetical protein [Chondromyces apiculatus]EYF05082.1 Hypothetical protein CAP_3672 [Chondromyces apiculatus DSM 436]
MRFAALCGLTLPLLVAGCGDDRKLYPAPEVPGENVFTGNLFAHEQQLDLLLTIDNSRSMKEKQEILAAAIPRLLQGLTNPPCLDGAEAPVAAQPAGPFDPCPAGSWRERLAYRDIHVGVISTSLGGHGSDSCQVEDAATRSNNDRGHLLARSSPELDGDLAEKTYAGKGFLAWDPAQELDGEPFSPGADDGEIDLEADSERDQNTTALIPVLTEMVQGVGQIGCGYEAQLESWYRFLVDPEPYETLSVVDGEATPQGIDEALLKQRADFLRPGSTVLIVQLSDENDCSMREGGLAYLAAQIQQDDGSAYRMPRARNECAFDPGDACCASCAQSPPECPEDPTCFVNGDPAQGIDTVPSYADHPNLRCFDQKRRFGVDYLYPLSRYEEALRNPQIQNRAGEIVDNPLFLDLDPDDADRGTRSFIFFAGIVGVPWQDLARDPADLSRGLKDSLELNNEAAGGRSAWDIILGVAGSSTGPRDPFMRESIEPRSGTNPITGDAMRPAGSTTPNAINGSEHNDAVQSDLQYACIFDLPEAVDCAANPDGCECVVGNDNPLCAPDPANGGERTLRVKGKAYPGLRQLQLLRALGNQGITGSVCPAQLDDAARADVGYAPVVDAMLDRLLGIPYTSTCLESPLKVQAEGQVSCTMVEGRYVTGACTCAEARGRREVSEAGAALVEGLKSDAQLPTALEAPNCFCEMAQLTGEALQACQSDVSEPVQTAGGETVHGWCYVDADQRVGAPELSASCMQGAQRALRFVGQGAPTEPSVVALSCITK